MYLIKYLLFYCFIVLLGLWFHGAKVRPCTRPPKATFEVAFVAPCWVALLQQPSRHFCCGWQSRFLHPSQGSSKHLLESDVLRSASRCHHQDLPRPVSEKTWTYHVWVTKDQIIN